MPRENREDIEGKPEGACSVAVKEDRAWAGWVGGGGGGKRPCPPHRITIY